MVKTFMYVSFKSLCQQLCLNAKYFMWGCMGPLTDLKAGIELISTTHPYDSISQTIDKNMQYTQKKTCYRYFKQ